MLPSEAVINNDDNAERSEDERVRDFFEEAEQNKDEDLGGDRVEEAVNNNHESAERSEEEHDITDPIDGLELESGVSFQPKYNYFTFYSEFTERKIFTQNGDHRIDDIKGVCSEKIPATVADSVFFYSVD